MRRWTEAGVAIVQYVFWVLLCAGVAVVFVVGAGSATPFRYVGF